MYSHNLASYLLFVLGLFVFVPTAVLLGVGMCAGGVVAACAVAKAHHSHVSPAFTPQPVAEEQPAASVYFGRTSADGSLALSSKPIGPSVLLDRGGFAQGKHAAGTFLGYCPPTGPTYWQSAPRGSHAFRALLPPRIRHRYR